jgi:hypothetical protein
MSPHTRAPSPVGARSSRCSRVNSTRGAGAIGHQREGSDRVRVRESVQKPQVAGGGAAARPADRCRSRASRRAVRRSSSTGSETAVIENFRGGKGTVPRRENTVPTRQTGC